MFFFVKRKENKRKTEKNKPKAVQVHPITDKPNLSAKLFTFVTSSSGWGFQTEGVKIAETRVVIPFEKMSNRKDWKERTMIKTKEKRINSSVELRSKFPMKLINSQKKNRRKKNK